MAKSVSCARFALALALAPTIAVAQTSAPSATPAAQPPNGQGIISLPPVDVQGQTPSNAGFDLQPTYPGGQVATGGRVGLLGNQNIFDTPFSTTNFTREQIVNQNALTLNDILLNDPAVRIGVNRFGDSQIRSIRGFPAQDDSTTFLGLPGMVTDRRLRLEGIERVELFEGPSTLLNGSIGSNNVGGFVNFVPKRAMDTPTRDLSLAYTSDSYFDGQADLGQRFGPNKEWGARFNFSGRGGDTPIEHQSESGWSGIGALDYRGERLRISLDFSHGATFLNAESQFYSLSPGLAVPKPPSSTRNVVDDRTTFSTISSFGVLHAEYDITDRISAFGTYGISHTQERYNGLYLPIIIDGLGNATISDIPYVRNLDTQAGELGIRASFTTGFVAHRLTSAASIYDQETAQNSTVNATYNTNIYNPIFPSSFPDLPFNWKPSRSAESRRNSYAFADTLSVLDERVLLTAGARLQTIDDRQYSRTTGVTTTRYQQSRLSPGVALVVKITPALSLYGNYIEQLNSGGTAPLGAANVGQVLPPFVSEQKEVGVKYDFGRLGVTAALFEITRPQGALDAATRIYSANNEQRNRGLELKTFGELVPGVRVLGGVAFIDGVQTKSANLQTQGKTAIAVPVVNVSFGTEWDVPFLPGLTVTQRTIYTSKSYLDAANTQTVPGYAQLDLGARYRIERVPGLGPIVIRGGIQNVTNNNYWQASAGTFGLTLSAPRTFYLTGTISL